MTADVTRQTLVYPFPLGGYMAQLVIPRDLTQAEAERLCEFIRSLAIPEPTHDR